MASTTAFWEVYSTIQQGLEVTHALCPSKELADEVAASLIDVVCSIRFHPSRPLVVSISDWKRSQQKALAQQARKKLTKSEIAALLAERNVPDNEEVRDG